MEDAHGGVVHDPGFGRDFVPVVLLSLLTLTELHSYILDRNFVSVGSLSRGLTNDVKKVP